MGLRIDLHVHTRLYSPCSQIDPEQLIRQAVRAGLDGLVITEHHHQWMEVELAALKNRAGEPHFLLLAGFEYSSGEGDILIYGLTPEQAKSFVPGRPPAETIEKAKALGGVCIGAHPTRIGMGFDENILSLPLDALEVRSVNLKEHEQRLAAQLAADLNLRPIAASDAHQLQQVGAYCTEFDVPIQSMQDLRQALRNGTFHPAESSR